MVLRIDPRLPLVWRTPHSLQVGIDDPAVVLTEVTSAEERMLAALVSGVSRSGLAMIAASAGAPQEAVEAFLDAVAPALETADPHPRRPVVSIVGAGSSASLLADVLAASGVAVRIVSGDDAPVDERDGLAVIVAQFVLEPEHHGLWLRRDMPHLPVVFGDTGASVGPMIEPGRGPCLYCLERRRTEANRSRPAIAAQLWGRRSGVDGGVTAAEVASTAARIVLERLDRGPAPTATAVRIDGRSGVRSSTVEVRHPECGCEALPGNGTADEWPSDEAPPPPRRAAVVAAHG